MAKNLTDLKIIDLKNICDLINLDRQGTKNELISRIKDYFKEQYQIKCDIINGDTKQQINNASNELNKWKKLVGDKENDIVILQEKIKCLQKNIEEIKIKSIKLQAEVRRQNKLEVKNLQVKKPADINTKNDKQKMLVIGDSHSRGLSEKIGSRCTGSSVTGSVHPGAGFKDITVDLPKLVASYNTDDTVILIAGANDVYKNNLDIARKQLIHTLRSLHSVKVVVIGIPQRHDLQPWSCVNKEIVKANRIFNKIIQAFTNTSFVDVSDLERKCFTKHGLHLNDNGKTVLADSISLHLKNNLRNSSQTIPLEYNFLNCHSMFSTKIT